MEHIRPTQKENRLALLAAETQAVFLLLFICNSSDGVSSCPVRPDKKIPRRLNCYIYFPIESNSSQISLEGGAVARETATIATQATMKAGRSS